MLKMSTEYLGFKIEWNDFLKEFIVKEHDETVKQTKTLEDCRLYIEGRNKTKYHRVAVLTSGGWGGGIEPGEATSLVEEGASVWVTLKNAKKERVKKRIQSVYLDNDHNRLILTKLKNIDRERKALDSAEVVLMKSFQSLKTSDMKEVKK